MDSLRFYSGVRGWLAARSPGSVRRWARKGRAWYQRRAERTPLRLGSPRILIIGTGKSGTTALYYMIEQAFPRGAFYGAFEPQNNEALATVVRREGGLLCKLLPNTWAQPLRPELLAAFDRRILVVRDPRDMMVSWMLYQAWDSAKNFTPELEAGWLELLEQKETDPGSVSMGRLLEHMARWNEPVRGSVEALLTFFETRLAGSEQLADALPDAQIMRYEDMVAGRLEELEAFLGRALPRDVQVARTFRRVVRTRSAGNWRAWFTPADEALLRPRLERYMRRFGYDGEDWTPDASAGLAREHVSDYVRGLLADKRGG